MGRKTSSLFSDDACGYRNHLQLQPPKYVTWVMEQWCYAREYVHPGFVPPLLVMQNSIATVGDGGTSDNVAMYHDGAPYSEHM
eukprot:3678572-Amphidinium_carterae.2